MPECADRDCDKPATHYCEVTVAPYSYPIERGMKMQFGLGLCFDHARTVKGVDLFTEETKKKLREATRITTKSDVPLDFTRVKVEPRLIGDDLWKLLKQGKSE